MRRNRADSLHRTLAASTFSKRAGADEQAAAMTGPAAPTEIIFVRVAAASDRAPASIGKVGAIPCGRQDRQAKLRDRKSTRLNSSHITISYAVFCLKKKKKKQKI